MKYIALLRGINVGGNSLIKMADLKIAVEKCGYQNVATYIQSGNVIFETNEGNSQRISKNLELALSKAFHIPLRVVVQSHKEFEQVISSVPDEWKKPNDIRCYIAFVREPVTVKEVIQEIKPKETVDRMSAGPGVVYLTTEMSGLTRSGFTKLVGTKIYKDITIRNYTTTKKLFELMK